MKFKLLSIVLLIVSVGWASYEIVGAILISNSTGILKVETTDPNAVLEVSQTYTNAQYIGNGNTTVRLKPGTYLLSASDQGVQVMKSVQINLKQKTVQNLDLESLISSSTSDNNLLKKLPVLGPASEYNINYYLSYSNGQSQPIITIGYTTGKSKLDAINWLSYAGFNPSNFQIQYTNITPPPSDSNYYVGGQ